MSLAEKSTEKITNNINATRDWSNNKDKIHLNHDLKNHEVDELIKDIIANGVIKIKTFNITYRKE